MKRGFQASRVDVKHVGKAVIAQPIRKQYMRLPTAPAISEDALMQDFQEKRPSLTAWLPGARIEVLHWRHEMVLTSSLEVRSSSSILFSCFMLIVVV